MSFIIAANEAAKAAEEAARAGAMRVKNITVGNALERWMATHKGIGESTREANKTFAKMVDAWAKRRGIQYLRDITPAQLLTSRREKGVLHASSSEQRVFDRPDGWRRPGNGPKTGSPTGSPPAPAAASRPERPAPPTRDPNTPGYVTARELPDSANAPANGDGNFIIGPTHTPAPEMSAQEGVPQGTVLEFTMNSADSKVYPGIARETNTFGATDPTDPGKLVVTTSRPAPYTRRVAVLRPPAIRPRHNRAIHCGGGRTRPGIVHGP